MPSSRSQYVRLKMELLKQIFTKCLATFDKKPPFSRHGQLEFHQQTIQRRMQLRSAANAIGDDAFLKSLYKTLQKWGIGRRGSRLVPFSAFVSAVKSKATDISALDGLRIDDPTLDIKGVTRDLWSLIESLGIVDNQATLVACSKALHHILPELVVPIDRKYTRVFFEWHENEFQYHQERFFRMAFEHFADIAQATKPTQYVGGGWHTCRTKILDNAIIGLEMLLDQLAALKQQAESAG